MAAALSVSSSQEFQELQNPLLWAVQHCALPQDIELQLLLLVYTLQGKAFPASLSATSFTHMCQREFVWRMHGLHW